MIRFNRKSSFAITALLLCVTGSAFAQPATPTGTWTGVLRPDTGTGRIHIDVSFDPKHASLHLGDPANCRVDASYVDTESDGSHYTFKPPQNGGVFCQKLHGSDLIVTPSAPHVILALHKDDVRWSGTLDSDTH